MKKTEQWRDELETLKSLRDELQVQAHLAGLEAKEAWTRLEPQFETVIADAQEAGKVTVGAVRQLVAGFGQVITAVRNELNRPSPRP